MADRRKGLLDDIEAKALFNFELLLHHWGIDYIKVSPIEYDFLSPMRTDKHFGACRFNVDKGKGADFAGTNYANRDYERIGRGFTKEDFASFGEGLSNNWGFNVIGLCQRVHNCPTYTDAAVMLREQLHDLEALPSFVGVTKKDIKKRKDRLQSEIDEKIKIAGKIWEKCSMVPGSLGETYLNSRGIYLKDQEPNMRFHPAIMNGELKKPLPALLFKVQQSPEATLCAIHRVYLKSNGTGKAPVKNPKMALGSIKGAGIWLGSPGERLSIVEGPENALSIRMMGASFVVCTVNAANFSCLSVPPYVKEVVLLPDQDDAGRLACIRATEAYRLQGKTIKVKFPPLIKGRKKTDWNDLLVE